MLDLSVIIPTYNEAPNIRTTTESVVTWLGSQDMTWEVLLVDDGSTDDTVAIERELEHAHEGVRVLPFTPNHGKGYVVRQGMLAGA